MKKSLTAIALVAFFAAVPAAALEDGPAAGQASAEQTALKSGQVQASAAAKAGSVLLDKLTGTFKHLAETGAGGREALQKSMQALITEARAARAQNQVDAVFFFKFNRLMTVIQLAIVEDPQGILAPLIDREVGAFVEEVTGESVVLSGAEGKRVGIGTIAGALADEILNLKVYLETLPRREAMRQDFYKQFSPGRKE
ncbi:MAG: hypothetical protein FJY83_09595 [Candidatus Aminicenantes bacterium]|nr:hypothetical protein [Candidatus Aminicenantes bacterium]